MCSRPALTCPSLSVLSSQAFDVLERLDPAPEYLEGKKGAACGAFQMIVAGKEPKVGQGRRGGG